MLPSSERVDQAGVTRSDDGSSCPSASNAASSEEEAKPDVEGQRSHAARGAMATLVGTVAGAVANFVATTIVDDNHRQA